MADLFAQSRLSAPEPVNICNPRVLLRDVYEPNSQARPRLFFQAAVMRPNDIMDRVCDEGPTQFAAGFVGGDQLANFMARTGKELSVVDTFEGAMCRLCIAGRDVMSLNDLDGKCVGVSSSLEWLVKKRLKDAGVSTCQLVVVDGSVEALIPLGEVDAIVDLVESGATLKANNLQEGVELGRYSVVMVTKPSVARAMEDRGLGRFNPQAQVVDKLRDTLRTASRLIAA